MQFTEYDVEHKQKLDRTKTWINPKYKQIFSSEIRYNTNYQIITKYNNNTCNKEFYIAFVPNPDKETKRCRIDELGRMRINISSIWNELFSDVKVDTNIIFEYVETINDCDIFSIESY